MLDRFAAFLASLISNSLDRYLKFIVVFLCLNALLLPTALAAPQETIEVTVNLGNTAGELRFFPDKLEFKTGNTYKLILANPSPTKHYFTAKDFADASWTKKVDTGKVEIKGAIHELEIRPQGSAQWVFVPMKTGKFELHCSVKGHTEAGMTGEIAIL